MIFTKVLNLLCVYEPQCRPDQMQTYAMSCCSICPHSDHCYELVAMQSKTA